VSLLRQNKYVLLRDAETGKRYVFLTNFLKLAARTIAGIYQARWQVELFSKWVKKNQEIKSFVGTSKYAILTQIWTVTSVYLLLVFSNFQSKLHKSMQQVLQLNLFEEYDSIELPRGEPRPDGSFETNQII